MQHATRRVLAGIALLAIVPAAMEAQTSWTTGHHEKDPATGRWTDYKNPVNDSTIGGVSYYRITICTNFDWGRWAPIPQASDPATITGPSGARGGPPHPDMKPTSGTDGAIELRGRKPPRTDEYDITFRPQGQPPVHVHLTVRVIDCPGGAHHPVYGRPEPPPPAGRGGRGGGGGGGAKEVEKTAPKRDTTKKPPLVKKP